MPESDPLVHAAHFRFHTLHLGPHTPHSSLYTLQSTLCTSHYALCAPHSTLCRPHSTCYTFTLYTLRFALHPHNFAFFTLHAVWSLGLVAWLHCHIAQARLPLVLNFGFALCVSPSRAAKGPLRCRKWTFESFTITIHHVGYADFPHPFRAKVTIYS